MITAMLLRERRARVVLNREPIAPPSDHAPSTFICPSCDVILWDEVTYTQCPVCDLPVDWVDITLPVWCCSGCDALQNQRVDAHPRCVACDLPMQQADVPEPPRPPEPAAQTPAAPPGPVRRALRKVIEVAVSVVMLGAVITPLLSLALDPTWRDLALALAAPIVLVPLTMAGLFMWAMRASFRELRDLAADRVTRIIHGLEHAAIKIMERDGQPALGGLTRKGFFEVYVSSESANPGQAKLIRRSTSEAIRRVRDGERRLAFDRRCGTSLLIAVLLVALAALASGVVGLFMHLRPQVVLAIGVGFVALVVVGARPLGLLAQRLLTVSTALRSARVLRIVRRLENDYVIAYEVHLSVRPRA